jgi:hypothetical protein
MKRHWLCMVVLCCGCNLVQSEATKKQEASPAGANAAPVVANVPAATAPAGQAGQPAPNTPPAVPVGGLDAGSVSWQGDIGVNVIEAKITPVTVLQNGVPIQTKNTFLVLGIYIQNKGDADFAYQHPLYPDAPRSEYALYNDANIELEPENGGLQWEVVGQFRECVVKGHQAIKDLLIFKRDNLGDMRLSLKGFRFNGSEDQVIQFKIPRQMVRYN